MKKQPKKKGPPPPPQEHPSPWASDLWKHLDLIRSLRRGRHTWKAIAEHLDAAYGIKLKFRTVRNFYARAVHAKIPLGFEPEPAAPTPKPSKPAPKPTPPDALGVDVPPTTPGTELFKKTKNRYGK